MRGRCENPRSWNRHKGEGVRYEGSAAGRGRFTRFILPPSSCLGAWVDAVPLRPPNARQAPDAVPETKPGAKELSGRAGDVTSLAYGRAYSCARCTPLSTRQRPQRRPDFTLSQLAPVSPRAPYLLPFAPLPAPRSPPATRKPSTRGGPGRKGCPSGAWGMPDHSDG